MGLASSTALAAALTLAPPPLCSFDQVEMDSSKSLM